MSELVYSIENFVLNIRNVLNYNLIQFKELHITVGTILAIPLILIVIRLFFKFFSQF